MSEHKKLLILYDGVCHLCNWWVRFLIRIDKLDRFRFAAMQKIPEELIPAHIWALSDQSVIVYHEQQYAKKSDAVLIILKELPAPWCYLSYFRFLPCFIRDGLYSGIAKIRYQVFGQYEACPVIPPEWKHKFPENDELSEILN